MGHDGSTGQWVMGHDGSTGQWVMGQGSGVNGSWVNAFWVTYTMGQMGHGGTRTARRGFWFGYRTGPSNKLPCEPIYAT